MSEHPKPAEIEDVLSSIRRLVAGGQQESAPRAQPEGKPAGQEEGTHTAEGEADAETADPPAAGRVAATQHDETRAEPQHEARAEPPEAEDASAAPDGEPVHGADRGERRPGAPLSALVLTPALRVGPGHEDPSEDARAEADPAGDDAGADTRKEHSDEASGASPSVPSPSPRWPRDPDRQPPRHGFGFGIVPSEDPAPSHESELADGSEDLADGGSVEAGGAPMDAEGEGADLEGEETPVGGDAATPANEGDEPLTLDRPRSPDHAADAPREASDEAFGGVSEEASDEAFGDVSDDASDEAFGGASPGFMNDDPADDAVYDAEAPSRDGHDPEGEHSAPPGDAPRGPIISPGFARQGESRSVTDAVTDAVTGDEGHYGSALSTPSDTHEKAADSSGDAGPSAPASVECDDGSHADALEGPAEDEDDGPLAPETSSRPADRASAEGVARSEEVFNLFDDGAGGIDERALRALVVDVVHRELQGALGERVSRNIRALVRREVAKALEARDLD